MSNVQIGVPMTDRTFPYDKNLVDRIFNITRKTIDICIETCKDDNLKEELQDLKGRWNDGLFPDVFILIYATAFRVQASMSEDGPTTFTLLALMYIWGNHFVRLLTKFKITNDEISGTIQMLKRISLFWDEAREKFKGVPRCDVPLFEFFKKHPSPGSIFSIINPQDNKLFEKLKDLGTTLKNSGW